MSNISSVSTMTNPYLPDIKTLSSTQPKAPTTPTQPANSSTPTAPVDSDGDHDGSGLNVKA